MTKHLFAWAIPALLAVGSVGVEAQRPVNDRLLDRIPVPELPMLPDDDDDRRILAFVRNTPADNLDAALPALPLERWLTETLLSYNSGAARPEWRLERCEDFTSDLPRESSELCAIAKWANISPPDKNEKALMLILAVGDWREAIDGRSGWVVRSPEIRDFFIQTADNSLDIRSLSELTAAFDSPADRWPTAEFELGINASPLRALPGETVTLRIEVRNKGNRDASRAEVQFAAFTGDSPDDAKEYRYQWFPSVPAGRSVAVELPIALPEGRGVFSASARPFSTRKRYKEDVMRRNHIFLWVHQVTDAAGLPAVAPR